MKVLARSNKVWTVVASPRDMANSGTNINDVAVKLAELLELPEGMGVSCLMPLGYPAEEPAAPKRKEVADLLSVK